MRLSLLFILCSFNIIMLLPACNSASSAAHGPITWGKAVNGLVMGLSVTDNHTVHMHLKNVSKAPLVVLSHVETHEKHFDWYALRLEDGQGKSRLIRLTDDRERSTPVRITLQPGGQLEHIVDVIDWSARRINGSKRLNVKYHKMFGTYTVTTESGVWNGQLEAGPIDFNKKKAS